VTIQPTEAPTIDHKANTGDQLRHIYCLGHGIPDQGLCGAPRNRSIYKARPFRELAATPDLCIVCADIAHLPCNICGR